MIKMYPGNKLESLTKFCKSYEEGEYYFIFPAENFYQLRFARVRESISIYHKVFGWKHNCCSNTSDRRRQENSIKERSEGEVYSV